MKKFFITLCCFLSSACFSPETQVAKFYMLSSFADEQPLATKKISVAVEPVTLPDYLDRPQIILRKENSSEMIISEENRWASSLSEMIQRVLANDLKKALPQSYVRADLFGEENFNYLIDLEIDTMNGILGQKASLVVWWSISNGNGKVLFRQKSEFEAPYSSGYEEYVHLQSQLFNQLSQEIAQKLLTMK